MYIVGNNAFINIDNIHGIIIFEHIWYPKFIKKRFYLRVFPDYANWKKIVIERNMTFEYAENLLCSIVAANLNGDIVFNLCECCHKQN